MDNQIKAALRGVAVETGSLVCLGCGHEHNCGTHGCAIIRAAADALEELSRELDTAKSAICEMCRTRGKEQHILCGCASCKYGGVMK